jgi:hypothetical protein
VGLMRSPHEAEVVPDHTLSLRAARAHSPGAVRANHHGLLLIAGGPQAARENGKRVASVLPLWDRLSGSKGSHGRDPRQQPHAPSGQRPIPRTSSHAKPRTHAAKRVLRSQVVRVLWRFLPTSPRWVWVKRSVNLSPYPSRRSTAMWKAHVNATNVGHRASPTHVRASSAAGPR